MIRFLISTITLLLAAARLQAAEIRIGIITDLSSGGAYIGNQTRLGAELARDELLAEGKQVRLVFGDHQSNNVKAASEAEKMISVDDVQAIFSNFSGPARAIAPVALKTNRLYVYTAAAVSPLHDNPHAFKSYVDNHAGCRAIAEMWLKEGVNRIGVLKPETEFGELCADGAGEAVKNIIIQGYNLNDPVSAQVLRFRKAKGVVGILNPSFVPDIRNMLLSVRQLGLKAKAGITEDSFTEDLLREFPQELEGAITYGMPRPSEDFLKRLSEKSPGISMNAIEFAGLAYLHVKQIGNAFSECPASDLNCVEQKLKASPADNRFGFLGWKSDRTARFRWVLRRNDGGKLVDAGVVE